MTICENMTTPDLEVYIVSADDLDAFNTVQYRLDDQSGFFTIHASTGRISFNNSIDFETPPRYFNISVIASDGHLYTMTTLVLTICDSNDNSPIFSNPIFRSNINENSTVNSSVYTDIVAFDSDSGTNGQITYSISRFFVDCQVSFIFKSS